MQEICYSFETLERELLEKLEHRGCSPVTITRYRYLCNSIIVLRHTVVGANRILFSVHPPTRTCRIGTYCRFRME